MSRLFPIIGAGSSTHAFTKSMFEVMLEDGYSDALDGYSEDTYKAYFNGNTGISRIAKTICVHMEPENFVSYIDDGFTDAIRDSLCVVFKDIIPDCDSFNISQKLSELFADILRKAASSKRKTASKKGALPKVELPDESPSEDNSSLRLSENDKNLLNDFHNDFDSAIEKCIASDQTDVLFTASLFSKINRLYDDKWRSAVAQFEDIGLQSDILSSIATLREYCKTLDPDLETTAASVRKLKIKLRDNYVKTHPDSFSGLFPYNAFIDDWDDEG
nr:MAG TPA: hypothetical protein [Caudoviricetes sp.]